MSFNMTGKHNAKIITITCSGTSNLANRDLNYNTLQFDTVSDENGSTGSSLNHGVSINKSAYEITLSANNHYYGLGFFAVGGSGSYYTQYHIVATDTSDNFLDADDGFFSYDLGYSTSTYASSVVNPLNSITTDPYNLAKRSSNNMLFKMFKSTGNNSFTFKLKGGCNSSSSSRIHSIRNDGTQLMLLEMS